MSAPPRGALLLVYFTAATLAGVCTLELLLYLAGQQQHQKPVSIVYLLLLAVPLAASLVVLIKARAVAAWISDRLDL